MERERLLDLLSASRRHVEDGESQIAAKKRIIDDLQATGGDTADAVKVLRMLELSQSTLMFEYEKILDALDKLPLFEDEAQS